MNTICSSPRICVISCGRMSGRRDSIRERVRDDPEACELRLIWLTSTVV